MGEAKDFRYIPNVDKIIIVPDSWELEKTSKSGLVYVEHEEGKPVWGTVVAVGGKNHLEDYGFELSPGDRILYTQYSGTKLVLSDEQFLLIAVRDIYIIEKGNKSNE